MKLSVAIITLNEGANIARAIKSASFADEIVVIDSNSQDDTVQRATTLGAKVFTCPFEGYGQQKNLAASHCRGDWIFSMDADEEITLELRSSILNIINHSIKNHFLVYMVNRRTQFCGKWIKHGGWYPDFLARLYKKGHAKWTCPEVHEILEPISEDVRSEKSNKLIGYLDGHLNHYSFPNFLSQITTNIKYAKLGAKILLHQKGRAPYLLEMLTRPFFKFMECYFIKKGFMDGKYGLIIAINASYSVFMKYGLAYFSSRHLKTHQGIKISC
jgi:glycosyltransferase involved in cell wall biosynthesis